MGADPAARAVTQALAARTGTDPDDWFLVFKARYGMAVVFRALRPYARSVTVLTDELRADLHDDGDGFFSGVLPLREVPEYRLRLTYEGSVREVEDPYRFLPTLGDLDLHLIGEGRHEELWKVLGAHPMTHQGVTGTRFSVWAPNARGVRVAGTFNYWDGTGFPLRSLGGTGVWELFVPGIGEGELYKFEITRPDGSKTLRADPMARRTEAPPDTSSIVCASAYEWGDAEWLERRGTPAPHEAPFSVTIIGTPSSRHTRSRCAWKPLGSTFQPIVVRLPMSGMNSTWSAPGQQLKRVVLCPSWPVSWRGPSLCRTEWLE